MNIGILHSFALHGESYDEASLVLRALAVRAIANEYRRMKRKGA